ncbi:unnamed protein product [Withania somnifera]
MEFYKRKLSTLASMSSPEPDKSPKGNIDTPIIPLLNTLNLHSSYFTTSSCSGRISILSQSKRKSKGGKWVFISHEKTEPHVIISLLFPLKSSVPVTVTDDSHSLVFRFEPLIISVECKDVEAAHFLVSLAILSGFRESGITSVNKRVIIAIRCSIRLEVPLGDNEKIMVSPEYVEYLVELANEKMEANRRRTDNFLDTLLKNGFLGSTISNGEFLDDGTVCSSTMDSELLEKSLVNGVSGNGNSKRREFDDSCSGSGVAPEVNAYTVKLVISGESIVRLFLWGHSASTVDNKKVLIFGGFGGMGRHARRDDLLLLDLECGKLEVIDVLDAPCPCVGHTSTMIGDSMYVIAGRADPSNILNDVWVFNVTKKDWRLLECLGSPFLPRHRHAAAAVGSRIYVFGRIHNDLIHSSLYVFDTLNFEWSELQVQGDLPCARHSHSMAAYGTQIFLFGGYDGQKAVPDLHSFDMKTCLWKKEKMIGRPPAAKFSHSMFVFKKYLGIVHSQDDGKDICFPVTENFCALFDQRNNDGDVSESVCQPEKDTCMVALNILIESGATILADEIVKEAVGSLLSDQGLPLQLLEELPSRWERLGDIVVLPVTSFKDSSWDLIGQELWFMVAKSLGANRLARQGRIAPTGTRDSTLEILVGDNGWVNHRENGIIYSFDATKCMFSWGNLSEKLRMGHFDCNDEVIVDLFAGIGYFVLPFLVRDEGGVLHIHGNVKDSEENVWTNYVSQSIRELVKSEGHDWDVTVEHVERVKWYAPHIRHLVADVRCKKIQT